MLNEVLYEIPFYRHSSKGNRNHVRKNTFLWHQILIHTSIKKNEISKWQLMEVTVWIFYPRYTILCIFHTCPYFIFICQTEAAIDSKLSCYLCLFFFHETVTIKIYAILFICEAAWWRTAFWPCLQYVEHERKSRRSASVDVMWSNSACKSTGCVCTVGMGQVASCSSISLMLWVLLKCAAHKIVWDTLLVVPMAVSRIQGLCHSTIEAAIQLFIIVWQKDKWLTN